MSMRQMVDKMATIQLMVGLFSTGLTNGMFMSQGGGLPCLHFTTITHTMPRALSSQTLLHSIQASFF
jgi:hypothetical protein